jgi:geranylgeranylglycerol-phosphate geranylgeranyltransferase
MFSEMGSFALNDYLDIESDKINNRTDRPLVRGSISPKFALWFSMITILASLFIAWFINLSAFVISLLFNVLALLYNFKLKDLPLLGNLYIAITMAIPFIFGNFVVVSKLSSMSLLLATLGFVSGLAREIVKSIQDMKGDTEARKSKTLPLVVGQENSLRIACFLYLVFIPLSILPFLTGLKFSPYSVFLVAFADAGLLYNIFLLIRFKDYKTGRKLSLICLFIGLLGLFLAVL